MTATASALFKVPPFPGSRPHRIFGRDPSVCGTEEEADRLIAAIRTARVGGPFWDERDPWRLFDEKTSLELSGSDPLALLAAIAGRRVACADGGPFSALDALAPGSPPHRAVTRQLVLAYLLKGIAWHDPVGGERTSPLEVVAQFADWRRLILHNSGLGVGFGFARWKRDTVAALLWNGRSERFFRPARAAYLDALPPDGNVALWKARVPPTFVGLLHRSGRTVVEVEDGFIRSIGLGADCVPPLSIVVDDLGAHYDPSRPSRLEQIVSLAEPNRDQLARAAALRASIAASGISKYGVAAASPMPRRGGDKRHLLVVGQVEDDRSVLLGGCGLTSNRELLARVRAANPDAHITYRPHPDVEAGHRAGHVPQAQVLALADAIDRDGSITALIAMADEVHVLTSLAGFEALLHGKAVVTHGVPFYAGWGLTTDLGPVPARRGAARSLDHLVSAVLIVYPRYLDPVTRLPCSPERLIARIEAGVGRRNAIIVTLRRGVGRINLLLGRMLKTR